MSLLEKQLFVKRSGLPGSGKGLFTKKMIPKNTRIIEYRGKVSKWNEADHHDGFNGYIYYVSRNYVIDAMRRPTALARYANDAKGLTRVKGIVNNARYEEENRRVYIVATKDIPAGGEILVQYGKEYWDVIRKNYREAERERRLNGEASTKKKSKLA
jgi:uncharacterized protein